MIAKKSLLKSAVILALAAVVLSVEIVSAEPAVFKPLFSRYRFKPSQPFAGSMEFVQQPQYGKPARIKVSLTALADLDTVQTFEFVNIGPRGPEFEPARLTWETPIDSGMTREFEVTFTPEYVGGFEILFTRLIERDWQTMGRLMLLIDEDGKTICSGTSTECGAATVPPHPFRAAENLQLEFPKIRELKNQPSNRDFSARFEFPTPIQKGDTCLMIVNLECQRNLYQEVQFVVEHSTNVRVISMPESWGNRVGVNPDYRFLTDTLSFMILRDGLTALDFQVIGKHPLATRGEHITTSFPIFIVTSAEAGLLFLGDFDPIKRFSTVNPVVLGSLTQLPSAGDSNYRVKYALSQPDYRAASDSTAEDSTATNSEE